jgi:hypothetical protein
MNHRTGLDRSQTLLFPERLEDYVAAENPVRFVDAFIGPGESTDGGEPDDPGLQPQMGLRRAVAGFVHTKAGVEPGELRETHGSGRSKSPAKSLNRGGRPFFSFVGSRNSGKGSHHSPTGIFHLGRTTSNREKYFPSLLLTVNPARSFHTASRVVRRLVIMAKAQACEKQPY